MGTTQPEPCSSDLTPRTLQQGPHAPNPTAHTSHPEPHSRMSTPRTLQLGPDAPNPAARTSHPKPRSGDHTPWPAVGTPPRRGHQALSTISAEQPAIRCAFLFRWDLLPPLCRCLRGLGTPPSLCSPHPCGAHGQGWARLHATAGSGREAPCLLRPCVPSPPTVFRPGVGAPNCRGNVILSAS